VQDSLPSYGDSADGSLYARPIVSLSEPSSLLSSHSTTTGSSSNSSSSSSSSSSSDYNTRSDTAIHQLDPRQSVEGGENLRDLGTRAYDVSTRFNTIYIYQYVYIYLCKFLADVFCRCTK
jgi:hypothetical protein